MTDPGFRLVYITSKGHSGSTLTEMLLDAHPAITGLGEIVQLQTPAGSRCRCGLEIAKGCAFWSRVDAALAERAQRPLSELEVNQLGSPRFAADNAALFSAVAAASGTRVLVDSSKRYHRLEALLASGAFAIQVIHLVRNPYGVVYSNLKRGRDLVEHSRDHAHNMVKTRPRVFPLRYEELVDDPQAVLRRLMPWLGLEFDPVQLRWAEQDSHTIAGNPMRFSKDSTIRRDDAWQTELTWRQKLGIAWWTLPARVPGSLVYHAQRRLQGIEDLLLRRSPTSAR
jgi:hypothetical protein